MTYEMYKKFSIMNSCALKLDLTYSYNFMCQIFSWMWIWWEQFSLSIGQNGICLGHWFDISVQFVVLAFKWEIKDPRFINITMSNIIHCQ